MLRRKIAIQWGSRAGARMGLGCGIGARFVCQSGPAQGPPAPSAWGVFRDALNDPCQAGRYNARRVTTNASLTARLATIKNTRKSG